MNRIALKMALAGFFALALVGWASGLDMVTCSTRALMGAAALYVITRITIGWVIGILARAMAQTSIQDRRKDSGT